MAPCDCIVKEIFKTKHALVLSSIPYNLTIFIHIGIETIEIGENNIFKPLVKEGEQVKRGTPILEFDINELQDKVHTILTPVIISAESLSVVSDMEKVTGPCTANVTPFICINVHKDLKNKAKE
jgi:phosphotransferase system IIA component